MLCLFSVFKHKGDRARETEATKARVKEHKAFEHPGSLIDGCRDWKRCERHQTMLTLSTLYTQMPMQTYMIYTHRCTHIQYHKSQCTFKITSVKALMLPHLQSFGPLFTLHKTNSADTCRICFISSANALKYRHKEKKTQFAALSLV